MLEEQAHVAKLHGEAHVVTADREAHVAAEAGVPEPDHLAVQSGRRAQHVPSSCWSGKCRSCR